MELSGDLKAVSAGILIHRSNDQGQTGHTSLGVVGRSVRDVIYPECDCCASSCVDGGEGMPGRALDLVAPDVKVGQGSTAGDGTDNPFTGGCIVFVVDRVADDRNILK